jgi:hypothetical protein
MLAASYIVPDLIFFFKMISYYVYESMHYSIRNLVKGAHMDELKADSDLQLDVRGHKLGLYKENNGFFFKTSLWVYWLSGPRHFRNIKRQT